jgi:hypothetical protein
MSGSDHTVAADPGDKNRSGGCRTGGNPVRCQLVSMIQHHGRHASLPVFHAFFVLLQQ